MPDWTYQTIFRAPLRQLPYATSSALVFGMLGRLGRFVAGRFVIRMMGHAQAPADVRLVKGDWDLKSPCALGSGVDQSAQAISALSLFGIGLQEVGPFDLRESSGWNDPPQVTAEERARERRGTQWTPDGVCISRCQAVVSSDDLIRQLQRQHFRNDVPVLAHLLLDESTTAAAVRTLAKQLQGLVTGVVLTVTSTDSTAGGAQQSSAESNGAEPSGAQQDVDFRNVVAVGHSLVEYGFRVLLAVDAARLPPEYVFADSLFAGWLLNFDDVGQAVESLSSVVRRMSVNADQELIIVRADICEPHDGLRLRQAGADVVLLDEGLPIAGPGLPKRINAVELAAQRAALTAADATGGSQIAAPRQSWLWGLLLGIALTVGGIMALAIGSTRVVLPYDEEFLGMLREEICAINPQLLPFMSHDRVTLAGTMLALGPLYCLLAWFADRTGQHWAKVAWVASAFIGFFSFFSFLGFGYFDPFHAFISVVLFQLTLFGLRSDQQPYRLVEFDLHNSATWRRALWGQLLMVIHGAAILIAGVVISGFGMTTVFVSQDLEFMNTTRDALLSANPRLVPLVAHDRASFGGMLLATGLTVLLTALWGWQRGRRWLWWSLALTGTTAYGCALAIHWSVGYTSLVHLLPAYGGLAALWLALLLSRAWMFEDAALIGAASGGHRSMLQID
ncbi:MAG: hypothetical protein NXI04_14455 [Planctomycetaceae bacterium]|nr:hypothetical protein [Planctomycetaceae bacterium]